MKRTEIKEIVVSELMIEIQYIESFIEEDDDFTELDKKIYFEILEQQKERLINMLNRKGK